MRRIGFFLRLSGFFTPEHNVRIYNVLFAVLFIILYRFVYKNYLAVDWGYFGYAVNNQNKIEVLVANIFCLLPILFYKARKCLSDFVSILLYIMVHVPTIVALQYYYSEWRGFSYEVVFTFAMTIFFLASSNHISFARTKRYNNAIPEKFYVILCIISCLFIVFAYGSTLSFVSFEQIYDQREKVDVVAVNYPILGYLPTWAANFLGPLVLSLGLYQKNKFYIVLGALTLVLTYMALALKSLILAPFMIFGFFYIFKHNRVKSIVYLFPVFVIVISIFTLVLNASGSDIAEAIGSIFFLRTIGISSMLAPVYIDVFSTNSFTYFSHVRIINAITGMYPFKGEELGTAVWGIYSGTTTNVMNANANFLITDGIAGLGEIGIVLIAVVFYFLLVYLNKISNHNNRNLLMCSFTSISMALMNASMFTTLLSFGLLLAIVAFRFTDFCVKE